MMRPGTMLAPAPAISKLSGTKETYDNVLLAKLLLPEQAKLKISPNRPKTTRSASIRLTSMRWERAVGTPRRSC